ncbi:hypothetical protein AVEN_171775-1 [Araneus ventricosus]|uniref:Uncharacterized protein n=1 Tax=Araneus ventricosus TaxID=182803 RepID=A0A4Y2R587_ARAVE|nr:hypothetical protein AVEN_171775-1 [Araneus ventricosus]
MTIIFSSSSPSSTDHSDRLPHLLIPSPAQISSRAREPPPHIYAGRISAFMARKCKWNGWISKLPSSPLQFASVFRTKDCFRRGVVEFEWSGALLNIQLKTNKG